jgi:hypothetical protein
MLSFVIAQHRTTVIQYSPPKLPNSQFEMLLSLFCCYETMIIYVALISNGMGSYHQEQQDPNL